MTRNINACFTHHLAAIMKNISQKIKRLRKKKDWTQEDMAREIGVSLSTIQRWEKRGGNPIRIAARELNRLFGEAGIAIGKQK